MPRKIVGVKQSHASIMQETEPVCRVVGIAAAVVQCFLCAQVVICFMYLDNIYCRCMSCSEEGSCWASSGGHGLHQLCVQIGNKWASILFNIGRLTGPTSLRFRRMHRRPTCKEWSKVRHAVVIRGIFHRQEEFSREQPARVATKLLYGSLPHLHAGEDGSDNADLPFINLLPAPTCGLPAG